MILVRAALAHCSCHILVGFSASWPHPAGPGDVDYFANVCTALGWQQVAPPRPLLGDRWSLASCHDYSACRQVHYSLGFRLRCISLVGASTSLHDEREAVMVCPSVCVCVLIDEIRGCKVGCIASFRRTASHAEGVQRSRRPWRTLMEQWKRLSRDGSCSREDRTDASCNGGGSTSMGLCCWLDA